MRLLKVVTTAVMAIAAVSACAEKGPGLTPEHAAAIEDSVRSALQVFADTQVEGDWEGMVTFYSSDDDFIWLEDGKTAYESSEAVAEALTGLASSMSAARLVLIEPSVVALAPGVAAMSTRYEQSFTTTDGTSFSYGGAISAVLKNGPGGWQFLRGHSSSSSSRFADQEPP